MADVVQLPQRQVRSIRLSRKAAVEAVLGPVLGALPKPAKPCTFAGSPATFCAWVEPLAWLAVSEGALATASAPGALVTDISDRLVSFRISGPGAREVIAGGCDASIFRDGSFARVRFAGISGAFIARFAADDWRMMVDVSLSATFADWLRQAAADLG